MSLVWDKLLRPIAFRMNAERAHELGLKALESGLAAPFYDDDIEPILSCKRFGLQFESPLGIAAGFDKNGVVTGPLARLGFGFVEVGTVTAQPQPGNSKPRLFRLPEDKALINRLGFNNDGVEAVAGRLAKLDHHGVIGVNIGRNKDVDNDAAIDNYLEALDSIWAVADYIAVNVSSPNTPGLQDLQRGGRLDNLLAALQDRNCALSMSSENPPKVGTHSAGKPLLIKIAPDLDDREIEFVVESATRHELAGVIASNTTTSRSSLSSDSSKFGDGGLSGLPLRKRSTEVIRTIYKLAGDKLPIIGVGGIFTAEDAFEKISSGASLVQAYTGFVYGGPRFPSVINRELAHLLRERGFASVDQAVGTGSSSAALG